MLDTIVLAPLKGERVAKVHDYKQVTNKDGGYVKVELQLEDRIYPYIIFPGKGETAGNQINYVVSCLRRQWGLEDAMSLKDALEYGKDHEFIVWFSHNELYNRMNVEFHEVVEVETTDLEDIEGA